MRQRPQRYQRFRSYGGRTYQGNMTYSSYNSDGSLSLTGSVPTDSFIGEVGEMVDFVTPEFREIIQNGGIVNSPMRRGVCTALESTTTGTMWNANGSKNVHSGPIIGAYANQGLLPNFPKEDYPQGDIEAAGIDMTNLASRASITASKGVASADTLAGVTLAELQKTVGMVASIAGGITDAITLLGSGKPSQAVMKFLVGKPPKHRRPPPRRPPTPSEGTKTVSQKWLEVRYGWAPTLYDLEGTLAALRALHNKRYISRGFGYDSAAKSTTGSTTLDGSFGHQIHHRLDEQWTANLRAYVLYTLDPAFLRAHKLGALSPLTTVWELVPLSFVVDWFVGVGDWLDAITPRVGVIYLAQGITTEVSYIRSLAITGTSSAAGSSMTGFTGVSRTYTSWGKQRDVGLQLPILPPKDVKINVKRALDAIALLATAALR